MTDKLSLNLKENILFCAYLNDFNMVTAAFSLQCSEAKSWHDSITKARHIYTRLKQGSPWDISVTNKFGASLSSNNDNLSIRKSPLNSSIGSRVSSLNNSHSGSVELNESKNVSIDFEKANSLSSDEGCSLIGPSGKNKLTPSGSRKIKPVSCNSLTVQYSNLGQSMPNLNQSMWVKSSSEVNTTEIELNFSSFSSNSNTLLVPGTSTTHSKSHTGQSNLLSPSQRGISYPPPSPSRYDRAWKLNFVFKSSAFLSTYRATLRRGFAVSQSTKNPPLVKTRNVTSQSQSCGWGQQQSALLHNFQHTSLINTIPPPAPPPSVLQQLQQQAPPHIIQQQSLQLFDRTSRNNSNDTSEA